MPQTTIIAGALMVAFLVFITVRGELPAYISVFTGTAKAGPQASLPNGQVCRPRADGNGIECDPRPSSVPTSSPGEGTAGPAVAKASDPGFNYFDPSQPVDWDDVLCRMDPSCQYGRY